MTDDTLGRFLERGLELEQFVASMDGFPDSSRRIVTERARAAVTSGDIDWAVYYMDRVVRHIAGAVGHADLDFGDRGRQLFASASADGSTLIDSLNAGGSTAELQAALREWQNAHGIAANPSRTERAPLPY